MQDLYECEHDSEFISKIKKKAMYDDESILNSRVPQWAFQIPFSLIFHLK